MAQAKNKTFRLLQWLKRSLGILLFMSFMWSCTYDVIKEIPGGIQCDESFTYNDQISEIINRNCAYGGCHDGASGVPGNFFNYNGLVTRITTGQIESRVLNQQDMPPNSASGPTMLTQSEMNDLTCWLNQGFPEN